MNFPEPGRKRGESKEEGMARRHKEGNAANKKLWKEIQVKEKARHEASRRLIEEKLGTYEDRPL